LLLSRPITCRRAKKHAPDCADCSSTTAAAATQQLARAERALPAPSSFATRVFAAADSAIADM
jgi:hypothetical protein